MLLFCFNTQARHGFILVSAADDRREYWNDFLLIYKLDGIFITEGDFTEGRIQHNIFRRVLPQSIKKKILT